MTDSNGVLGNDGVVFDSSNGSNLELTGPADVTPKPCRPHLRAWLEMREKRAGTLAPEQQPAKEDAGK
jgi:hypothetical protein